MAKVSFKAGDEYALKLSKLASGSDAIAKKAIFAASGIVADKIRANLEKVTSGKSSGDLEESLGITPIKRDKEGDWNAKIGFVGYDRNGVPNQLKARVLESGSSQQRKRPFVRPALNSVKSKAQNEMGKIIDEEIKKLGL